MPSLAIPLWLLFAATSQVDPLSPPPHGREVSAPEEPTKPTLPSVKSTPSATKPTDAKSPRSPKSPSAPTDPTPTALQPSKVAKLSPKMKQAPAAGEEPAEESVADVIAKEKTRRRVARKIIPVPDRDRAEVPERKNPWSADRYAAVVPPGLTLSALRSQISKASSPAGELPGATQDNSNPSAAMNEIEKARESLRQETARLEALIKTASNCGGAKPMPLGDPLSPQPVPSTALREAASEQIDSVSKAMKGMKPEQAAAMVARLDRELAAEILRRMKAVDAGAILGLLKPEMAAELATEIATRKPIYAKDKKGVEK